MGMTNYYRRFVKDFGIIAAPLFKLLKKGTKFVWNKDCQIAFDSMIESINDNAVLAFPNFNKQFHLTTDASMIGIGAVLSQEDESGRSRPVSFISRRLTETEQRYSTIEQECLEIVWAIGQLRYYLVAKEFVIFTDHKPLIYTREVV